MTNRKFAKPRKRILNQTVVAQFLKSIGFQVSQMNQEWRHLTAFGTYEGKAAVFKLASTLKTSSKTQNEYHWNEAVHLLALEAHPNFTVPKNLAVGKYGELFYFIAERFIGVPLAIPQIPISAASALRIPQIAQITREIELLVIPEESAFAQAHRFSLAKRPPLGERLFSSATEWAAQVPKNLDVFLQVIEKAQGSFRTCPMHGDFVIRQMYFVNGQIGLIDGEHAALKQVNHYDVAQFYLRLRSDYRAVDLARQYLQDFYALLPPADQDTFWEELKPVLCQRYIGDLWGAGKDLRKIEEMKGLGDEILADRIVVSELNGI